MWTFEVWITFMFITDLFFNFNTAYMEGPNYVIDKGMIASNYLRSWFPIDRSAGSNNSHNAATAKQPQPSSNNSQRSHTPSLHCSDAQPLCPLPSKQPKLLPGRAGRRHHDRDAEIRRQLR